MIETVRVPSERPSQARDRRARLDAEAVALLALPSGGQLGQVPLRTIQIEQRGERLRRHDDQQRALTEDVMGRPRASEVALEDARNEPTKTDPARESRPRAATAPERVERGGEGFRRELADARREAIRPTAAPQAPQSSAETGTSRTPAETPIPARPVAIQTVKPAEQVGSATRGAASHPNHVTSAAAPPSVVHRMAVTSAVRPAVAVQTVAAAGAAVREASAARGTSPVVAATGAARGEKTVSKTPAAATAQTAEAAAAERNDDANLERILRVVRMQLARDRSSATIRLDPEELGQIRMKLELSGAALTLDVEAEHDSARRLLAEQVDALRRGLEAAGITLERVEVRVVEAATRHDGSGGTNGSASHQAGPNDQGAARRDDAMPIGRASQAASETLESVRLEPIPAAESLVNILA